MPTNPTTPNSSASVDRLSLGVDSPRGTEPLVMCNGGLVCMCFEAEASAQTPNGYGCYCAEEA